MMGKAVKVLPLGSDPEILEELEHEARVYQSLQRLQGRTIPVVLYAGPIQNETRYGLVMSLAGCSLDSLSPDQRRPFERSATDALASLHAENWLHGDIKLSNFVLANSPNPNAIIPDDHVLIIDLGFAKQSDDPVAKEQEQSELLDCFLWLKAHERANPTLWKHCGFYSEQSILSSNRSAGQKIPISIHSVK